MPIVEQAPGAGALRVCRATTVEELRALAPAWERLLASCPAASPFHGPDWLVPWARHLGSGEPWVLQAWRDERLVGVLPLRLDDGVASPLGQGVTDYSGMLAAPGGEGEGAAAALLAAMAADDRWHRAVLDQIAPGDPLYDARMPEELVDETSAGDVCPWVPLPGAVAELRTAIPHALGPRVERSLRRLRREHRQVALESATAANVEETMEAFFRLHGARWSLRAQGGVVTEAALRAFHRDVAARMQAHGRLRLRALRLDGEVAAVLYGFAHGRRFYAYLAGFAPELAPVSPGSVR